ncbi:hypothetical protein BDN72DRAFT_685333 [Pluteus cervinus]|uniref:Uncharacterized protein n=1 Tax=Pluteus cervinus TaxID=181527 RepID=A0ACD3ASL0_9AGAR|nr:hypothetical protein BDN72DRAFT_685333 [Pluteus cervinus]
MSTGPEPTQARVPMGHISAHLCLCREGSNSNVKDRVCIGLRPFIGFVDNLFISALGSPFVLTLRPQNACCLAAKLSGYCRAERPSSQSTRNAIFNFRVNLGVPRGDGYLGVWRRGSLLTKLTRSVMSAEPWQNDHPAVSHGIRVDGARRELHSQAQASTKSNPRPIVPERIMGPSPSQAHTPFCCLEE